jgi:hypothetical protein
MHKAIPPLPQYAFMVWCLEQKDNFTFTFYKYLPPHFFFPIVRDCSSQPYKITGKIIVLYNLNVDNEDYLALPMLLFN